MTVSSQTLFSTLVDGGPNWWVHTTDVLVGEVGCAIARTPEGRPALLVPATGRAAGIRLATNGVMARVQALQDGDTFQDWLAITCLIPALDETFFHLCDDVLAHLTNLGDDDAVSVSVSVVEDWQELLTGDSSPLMSIEKCMGLLAELHTLEALCSVVGANKAYASWAGPEMGRVDFRFEHMGIEVKATRNRDRFKVKINGLLQLDDTAVGDLYLFAQQMEQVPEGGDCLPEALERLVKAGVPSLDLRTSVARIGYSLQYEDVYKGIRFTVLDERGVRVGDDSPRIVPASFVSSDVAEAISAVSYQIDLTDLSPAQGRLPEAKDVFKDLMK